MPFGFVAFHHPAPEHTEEFAGRCRQVIDAGRPQPGLLPAEIWGAPGWDAVVITGALESEDACRASADAVREPGAVPDGFSDREAKPRQAHRFLSR